MRQNAENADELYGPAIVMDEREQQEAWDMDEEEDDEGEDQEGDDGTMKDFQGIRVCIEYRKGEFREADEEDYGSPMGYPVLADYGYIADTISTEEGEERDCFIGLDEDSQRVFVAQLRNPDDPPTLMEEKVLLGFSEYDQAQSFVCAQYYPEMVENIYEMSLQDLKDQCEQEKTKARALKNLMQNRALDMARREAEDERIAEVSGFTGQHVEPFVIVTPDQL